MSFYDEFYGNTVSFKDAGVGLRGVDPALDRAMRAGADKLSVAYPDVIKGGLG